MSWSLRRFSERTFKRFYGAPSLLEKATRKLDEVVRLASWPRIKAHFYQLFSPHHLTSIIIYQNHKKPTACFALS
jgi:hypothetical protein